MRATRKKPLRLNMDAMQRLLLMLQHAGGIEALRRLVERPRPDGDAHHAVYLALHKPVIDMITTDGPRAAGRAEMRLRVVRGRFYTLNYAHSWVFVYEVKVPIWNPESLEKAQKIRRALQRQFPEPGEAPRIGRPR